MLNWQILSTAALALLLSSSATSQVRYRVTDIGTLGGHSYATGINESGQISGYSYQLSGGNRPYLFTDGSLRFLGSFGGNGGLASAVNDSGQVVGYSNTPFNLQKGFLYGGEGMQMLGNPDVESVGANINASGQVVGSVRLVPGGFRACIFNGSSFVSLGTLGGSQSSASDINDAGQVVGNSADATGYSHAFLYSDGAMRDLGLLPGGSHSSANAINERGDVVGLAGTTNGSAGFLYRDGVMISLGTLGGTFGAAQDVNNDGIVVGGSTKVGGSQERAFAYYGSGLVDLNTVLESSTHGFTLNRAMSINDAGQIVGYGVDPSGINHAFLLTPVPEPTTLAIFSIALLAIRKRRAAGTLRVDSRF